MIISLIVAMDERGGIGLNNQVPWHLPSDLRRFKTLTMGHHLILGRKTYESIGGPLPGRTMIIVTRRKDYLAAGCITASSLAQALRMAEERGDDEVFIGGGGTIYAQALPVVNRIYLTKVHIEVEAQVFFPSLNLDEWKIIHQEYQAQAEKEIPAYSFLVLERTGEN
jgi:dihydrofolate reductase